jgi:hypothetical protein
MSSPLTKQDLADIYVELSEYTDLPEAAVDFISTIANECFIPEKIEARLRKQIENLKKTVNRFEGKDVSSNARLVFLEEILQVLFSELDEMPLFINETYQAIAKIRLSRAK